MGGVGKARNAAGSSSSSHACFVLTRDAAFTLDLTFPYPYPRLARARDVVSSSALVALPFPFPSALRARVRAAARAAAVALASAARSRLARLVAVGPVVLVVTGARVEARVFAPERRRGGSRREWGHRDRVSSGAGREGRARGARGRGRLGRARHDDAELGRGTREVREELALVRARGAGLAERRRRETVSGRGGRRVARVGERREGVRVGSLPGLHDPRARRGTRVTILTVSEDARPAPDPSVPSFAVRVYLARSTFALANVILELVRHFSGMAAGGGWGPCAAGGKNPCAFRGMIATADPTRTWVSNSKLERRI